MAWVRWPDMAVRHKVRLVGWPSSIAKIPGADFKVKRDIKPKVLQKMVEQRIQAVEDDEMEIELCRIESWTEGAYYHVCYHVRSKSQHFQYYIDEKLLQDDFQQSKIPIVVNENNEVLMTVSDSTWYRQMVGEKRKKNRNMQLSPIHPSNAIRQTENQPSRPYPCPRPRPIQPSCPQAANRESFELSDDAKETPQPHQPSRSRHGTLLPSELYYRMNSTQSDRTEPPIHPPTHGHRRYHPSDDHAHARIPTREHQRGQKPQPHSQWTPNYEDPQYQTQQRSDRGTLHIPNYSDGPRRGKFIPLQPPYSPHYDFIEPREQRSHPPPPASQLWHQGLRHNSPKPSDQPPSKKRKIRDDEHTALRHIAPIPQRIYNEPGPSYQPYHVQRVQSQNVQHVYNEPGPSHQQYQAQLIEYDNNYYNDYEFDDIVSE